jgi:hypothetical protein
LLADHRCPARPELLRERIERIAETGSALIEDDGSADCRDFADGVAPRFRFCRQKADEQKPIRR